MERGCRLATDVAYQMIRSLKHLGKDFVTVTGIVLAKSLTQCCENPCRTSDDCDTRDPFAALLVTFYG